MLMTEEEAAFIPLDYIVTVVSESDILAVFGQRIEFGYSYSLSAFQKASASRLVDFLPMPGFSTNRLAQLTLLDFSGVAVHLAASQAARFLVEPHRLIQGQVLI